MIAFNRLLIPAILLLLGAIGCAATDDRQTLAEISVYFGNTRLNPDPADCAAVFPVSRRIPQSADPVRATLNELFKGPTADEQAQGYHSFFNTETAHLLVDFSIVRRTAQLNLKDLRETLAGVTSSCGSAEFLAQIADTLKQFPGIGTVRFTIENDSRLFYEWLGLTAIDID